MRRVRHTERLGLHLRIVLGRHVAIGPGKAELLERVAATGSIAASGRAMGMSYKRAWLLAEEMNTLFGAPLIEAAKGGPGGGHASLTPIGARVLATYRHLEQAAGTAAAPDLVRLQRELAPPKGPEPTSEPL